MDSGTTSSSPEAEQPQPLTSAGNYESELLNPCPRAQAWTEWLLVGGGCFLMAAVLRFIRIGYREYFGAEFASLDILSGNRSGNFIESLLRGDVSIFYMLLWGWSRAVSWGNEGLMRLPSALIGLGTWVAFMLFVRCYLRGTAFVICLLMFALNPTLIGSSIDATPFALLSLCAVVANHMAVRSLDLGGKTNWIGYGIAMAVGVATHPLFWFLLVSHFLFAVVRGRRTPKPFRDFCWVMLGVCLALAVFATFFGMKYFPHRAGLQPPSVADFMRNIVAIAIGDFPRYGANEFARIVMYLFISACLGFSYLYYRKRTAEARALPDNVVWIDDTQDVVGTWNHFSLRGFLLFQWVTFAVPALCIIAMGTMFSHLDLTSHMFIMSLPPLIVLIAMGIDAAPRSATTAMGVLVVLGMIFYNVCTLSDRGYGMEEAIRLIRQQKFDPSRDVVIYSAPDNIQRSLLHYGKELNPIPVKPADNWKEYYQRQAQVKQVVEGKDRAMVIYQDDRRSIGKRDNISPVRDWFNLTSPSSWDVAEKPQPLTNVEEAHQTELRIYKYAPAALTPATDSPTSTTVPAAI